MKNDILYGIMLTLLVNKKSTAKELAAKYEMSVRTIYRYLDTLNQAGVPIVSYVGTKGGVSIADNFKLDKTFFTKQEYERILTSLASFDQLSDGDGNRHIIDKFKSMSQCNEMRYVLQSDKLFVNAPVADNIKHKLSAFQEAVYQNKICKIVYHSRKGEITERTILPHAFAFNDGQWYVYAYCNTREDFRLFKISRVYTVIVTEETFAPMPLPEIKTAEDTLSYEMVEISLTVQDKCRLDVEEWLGIESVTKSGENYFAQSKQIYNDDLISKLMSFGDGIRILSPAEIKEDVKRRLQNALKVLEQE
jgi:predicted DNA-binding transcriptional regulator YafY